MNIKPLTFFNYTNYELHFRYIGKLAKDIAELLDGEGSGN